ncbi:MAG: CPXCG motif-containing cysteine-rich protein [Bdellovibrio bacteriovorus]
MNPIESFETQCPWCGSALALQIDCSAGDQRYVEDCAVCCQPIRVSVGLGESDEPCLWVDCARED